MSSFLTAWNFLTIIKIGNNKHNEFNNSLSAFPIVGLIIGSVLIVISTILHRFEFSPLVISVLSVVLLVVLTGALHTDGFADTFDGFYGGKSKEEILKIMKDTHIGAIGTISVVCLLLTKVSLLANLDYGRFLKALIIMPVAGRTFIIPFAVMLPYARKKGTGEEFVKTNSREVLLISCFVAFIILLVVSKNIVFVLFSILIFSVCFYLLKSYFTKKTGGVTGDILGMTEETGEVLILFVINLFL